MKRIKVCQVGDLGEGESRQFRIVSEGRYVPGFVLRQGGDLFAYQNKCRHLPITLDYADGRFLDEESQLIVCQTHGAAYVPSTGECVQGPCQGASLFPIPLTVVEGMIWVESEGEED